MQNFTKSILLRFSVFFIPVTFKHLNFGNPLISQGQGIMNAALTNQMDSFLIQAFYFSECGKILFLAETAEVVAFNQQIL